jgi:hypothetical protein
MAKIPQQSFAVLYRDFDIFVSLIIENVMPSSYEGIFMTQGFHGIFFSMLLNVSTINLSNYGVFFFFFFFFIPYKSYNYNGALALVVNSELNKNLGGIPGGTQCQMGDSLMLGEC